MCAPKTSQDYVKSFCSWMLATKELYRCIPAAIETFIVARGGDSHILYIPETSQITRLDFLASLLSMHAQKSQRVPILSFKNGANSWIPFWYARVRDLSRSISQWICYKPKTMCDINRAHFRLEVETRRDQIHKNKIYDRSSPMFKEHFYSEKSRALANKCYCSHATFQFVKC